MAASSGQVQVDLDQHLLQERGISADDVVNAVNAQNLIIPAGTEKVGEFEYNIKLNGSPTAVEEFNDLPIKAVNGTVVYVHDVAHVRDGSAPQTNVVRVDGQHASLMTIQKTGDASTLDIIDQIKERLPAVRAASPPAPRHPADRRPVGLRQGGHRRRGARRGHRRGADRPHDPAVPRQLALDPDHYDLDPAFGAVSIIALSLLGETINIMTLGGLALAVGILVDDATVAIESHQHASGKRRGRRGSDPQRCPRDRRAGAGCDALHLHRLRADVLPERRRALSLRAAGRSDLLRHARLLCPVAHADPDARQVLAAHA